MIDGDEMIEAIGRYNDFHKVQFGLPPKTPEEAEAALRNLLDRGALGWGDAFKQLTKVYGLSEEALLAFQIGLPAVFGKKELSSEARSIALAGLIIGLSLQREQA